MTREEVLVALANGLKYTVSGSTPTIIQYYTDAAAISSSAGDAVAAISARWVVVNYRDIHVLNPIRMLPIQKLQH
jgi:hypothetical protein